MNFIRYVYDSQSRSAAIMFAVIFVIIGLPLWWKTTEVYRVNLPYQEISSLKDNLLKMKIDVAVVFCDSISFNKDLKNTLNRLTVAETNSKLVFQYRWSVRTPHDEEISIFKDHKHFSDADKDLNDLNILKNPGMIWIYIMKDEAFEAHSSSFVIGRHRNVFVKNNPDLDVLANSLVGIVKNTIVKEGTLRKSSLALQNFSNQHLPDKDQMRSVQATPAYDITFTLMQSGTNVSWDIESAIEKYFDPVLKKLSLFADFNIKSQIFHLTKLNVNPKFDAQKNHYVLNSEKLPHVINPVEETLGSHISVNPNLNFLVYIPPKHQSPLMILNENGEPSKTNSFLSPRWGGFLFYNMKDSTDELDMSLVMKIFVTQFRSLLGLPLSPSEVLPMDNSLCADWEVDFLLRKRSLENIAISVASLNSLAQLLNEIRNIVINDDVGIQVYKSVEAIKQSTEHMVYGNLKDTFIHSKISFIASEKAFFDPSMLKLLYFPDDQKYAIYIPLFLPVSLPVLTSIVSLVKAYKLDKAKQE